MTLSAKTIAILILASAATLAARQVRDGGAEAGQAAITGNSVLAGVVMTDQASPQPVRRATVRIAGDTLPSTRLVGTDDDGRFTFDALPAGNFTVSVSKPGFVETFHGSTRPGRGPGVPVAVPEGERVDVTLPLLPGAVISGSVTDAYGKPARSVSVMAVEVRTSGATPLEPGRATTDDRGEYRIFGLPPGEYLVSASPSLQPVQSGPSRVVGEILATTDEEARWASAVMAGGGGSPAPGASTMPPPGRPVAYTSVYHPGTADPSAAATVVVGPGEERSGVGMALQIVAVARVSGRLINANGEPVTLATVSIAPRRTDTPSLADRLVSSGALVMPRATVTAPGFSISGVAPGEYTLVARSGSGQRRATAAEMNNERHWALADITVTGIDQTDIVLRLLPGTRLTGSVEFDGSSSGRPQDLSAVGLSLSAAGTALPLASTAAAVVDEDGDFLFRSIAPGSYQLEATLPAAAMNAGWTLKSAMLDGRDLADLPLSVEPGAVEIDDLEISFTDRAAAIEGRLIDAGGQPVSRFAIVVATTDRALWRANSRRIQAIAPATDGSFSIRGLPDGEYAIAAIQDIHAVDLADPGFLSQLVELGYTVTLREGDVVQQDLRVGGGE